MQQVNSPCSVALGGSFSANVDGDRFSGQVIRSAKPSYCVAGRNMLVLPCGLGVDFARAVSATTERRTTNSFHDQLGCGTRND